MKNKGGKEWYRILEVIRNQICKSWKNPTPFSVHDVVDKANVSPGPGSTAREMAAGYLTTLRKWGYIRKVGKLDQEGRGRPTSTFVITKYGATVAYHKAPEERAEEDFQKLAAAIEAFRDAQGEADQAAALKDLIKIYDQIAEERTNEYQAAQEQAKVKPSDQG